MTAERATVRIIDLVPCKPRKNHRTGAYDRQVAVWMEGVDHLFGGEEPVAVHFGDIGGSGFVQTAQKVGVGSVLEVRFVVRQFYERTTEFTPPRGYDHCPRRAVLTYPYVEGEETPRSSGTVSSGTTLTAIEAPSKLGVGQTIRCRYPDSKQLKLGKIIPVIRQGDVVEVTGDSLTIDTSRGPRTLKWTKIQGGIEVL